MAVRDVFIIEAPGKVAFLREILASIGFRSPLVVATKGHLFGFPPALDPIGIDRDFREVLRLPRDERRIAYLESSCRDASVHVMTDPDQEGDVIALDVAGVAWRAGAAAVFRCPPHGLDPSSLRRAIDGAKPISAADALPGRTRAIVDRVIGATFSKAPPDAIAVGRVSSALLATFVRQQAITGRVHLVVPSADGGKPFEAQVETRSHADASTLIRHAASSPPFVPDRQLPPPPRPWNMGQILVEASVGLGLSPTDSYKALQQLYESGRMSYPRSASHSLGDIGRRTLGDMAHAAGHPISLDAIPRDRDGPHDAPHPLVPFDITLDPRRLSPHEALLAIVGRRLVACAMLHGHEQPVDALLPAWARGLPWRRARGPAVDASTNRAPSSYQPYDRETAAVATMLDSGIGRPSTWPDHAARFSRRGLVDSDLRPTPRGLKWLDHTPGLFRDSATSRFVEQSVDALAAQFGDLGTLPSLDALPAPLRAQLLRSVAAAAEGGDPFSEQPRLVAALAGDAADPISVGEAAAHAAQAIFRRMGDTVQAAALDRLVASAAPPSPKATPSDWTSFAAATPSRSREPEDVAAPSWHDGDALSQ